ncbi:MAG: DUF507 family protein [Thermodesulfobacteriota bacterium]
MRLQAEIIEKISRLILTRLKDEGLLVFKVPEEEVFAKVKGVITADMSAEDELDREVENILKSHAGELGSGEVDYRKMFSMVKHKLARERGVVL